MPFPGPGDLASVVLNRFECLDAVVTEPRSKPDLVESLDIPRSTLDDIIRELEREDLVEYEGGLWQPTHSGGIAHELQRQYLDILESLADASPVIEALPADDDIHPSIIDGATVYEHQPHVANAELSPLLNHVEAASDVRVATPRLVRGFGRELSEKAFTDGDTTFEMIAPSEVHEWFATESRTGAEKLELPNVSFRRATVPFSFGLAIFDGQTTAITAFTDHGIAGYIVNDSERAIRWAEDQYNHVKADSEPVNFRRSPRDIDLN